MDPAQACPHPLTRGPWQRWESLSFVHWRYDPAAVRDLIHPSLTLEEIDGSAWVGLVPFRMHVGLPRRAIGPSTFPETNLRTYVVGPDGVPGVWFFSLDAARLAAVAVARSWFRLPYVWASMRVDESDDRITYTSRRPGGGMLDLALSRGTQLPRPSPLEVSLTARWALYDRLGRRRRVDHPPWPLERATVIHLRTDLPQRAGLPAPDGSPLVHRSVGVDVRLGGPEAGWSQGGGGP